jgi:hypothetical protein
MSWLGATALMVPPVVFQVPLTGLSAQAPSTQAVDAILYYDPDGGVRKSIDQSVGGQIVSDVGDWCSRHPNYDQGASWSVRVTHSTGSNRHNSGDSLNTWYDLSIGRLWAFRWNPGGAGPQGPDLSTYLVELSNDGGSTTYDSDPFTFSAFMVSP